MFFNHSSKPHRCPLKEADLETVKVVNFATKWLNLYPHTVISENDFSRAFMIKTTIPNQRILGNDEKFPSSSHRSAYSLIRFFSCLDNQHHFQEISSFSLLGFPCERNRFIKKDGILMTFDLSRNLP